MLGFNRLGQLGRLGNQMFQFAALRGIAASINADWCVPPSDFNNEWNTHQLFKTFELSSLPHDRIKLLDRGYAPIVEERFFHFDPALLACCPDHTSLHGYFQSEKWFLHIANSIKNDFTFLNDIVTQASSQLKHWENPIALHVRRTDYIVNSANHPVMPLNYYQTALDQYAADRQVVVFSDDPAWCKQQPLFLNSRFTVVDNSDNRIDLYLMTQCSDYIIANSSFSWWGAWLSNNANKRVIAPACWFGTGYTSTHDTKDLIPDTWTRI